MVPKSHRNSFAIPTHAGKHDPGIWQRCNVKVDCESLKPHSKWLGWENCESQRAAKPFAISLDARTQQQVVWLTLGN